MDNARLDTLEGRFDRVENKLDNIGASLLLLASIDERTGHVMDRLSESSTKVNDHEKRIQQLEAKVYVILTVATLFGSIATLVLQKVLG